MECPSLQIRATLMAAGIFFNPETTPSPSSKTDFDIVASALPYVDTLATKGYMSDLIRKARLLNRYDRKIFSMRERRQLMETVQVLLGSQLPLPEGHSVESG